MQSHFCLKSFKRRSDAEKEIWIEVTVIKTLRWYPRQSSSHQSAKISGNLALRWFGNAQARKLNGFGRRNKVTLRCVIVWSWIEMKKKFTPVVGPKPLYGLEAHSVWGKSESRNKKWKYRISGKKREDGASRTPTVGIRPQEVQVW